MPEKNPQITEDLQDVINLAANEAAAAVAGQRATKKLITTAAAEAAAKVYQENIAGAVNYYNTMERLLYNYRRLEALVNNPEGYMAVDYREKSKSIVSYSPGNNTIRQIGDDPAEELTAQRAKSYERTAANFREVERVVALFSGRKEFVVIRMYYFNEWPEGTPRQADMPQYTFEEIAVQLGKDEKTLRRWRTKLIQDMAVCMFGTPAAVSLGLFREERKAGKNG